ncbi:MAG: hypothetical protein V3S11_05680 [Elusimicrobiota bacterium]
MKITHAVSHKHIAGILSSALLLAVGNQAWCMVAAGRGVKASITAVSGGQAGAVTRVRTLGSSAESFGVNPSLASTLITQGGAAGLSSINPSLGSTLIKRGDSAEGVSEAGFTGAPQAIPDDVMRRYRELRFEHVAWMYNRAQTDPAINAFAPEVKGEIAARREAIAAEFTEIEERYPAIKKEGRGVRYAVTKARVVMKRIQAALGSPGKAAAEDAALAVEQLTLFDMSEFEVAPQPQRRMHFAGSSFSPTVEDKSPRIHFAGSSFGPIQDDGQPRVHFAGSSFLRPSWADDSPVERPSGLGSLFAKRGPKQLELDFDAVPLEQVKEYWRLMNLVSSLSIQRSVLGRIDSVYSPYIDINAVTRGLDERVGRLHESIAALRTQHPKVGSYANKWRMRAAWWRSVFSWVPEFVGYMGVAARARSLDA